VFKQRLSANSITRLENLNLPLLEELDISHNQIERLENMDRLVSLTKLNISRNRLSDIDYLLLIGCQNLGELEASYNRLPVSYLDHMLEIVKELPMLRSVTFMGNEMALNKYYRIKLCSMYQLKTVDALAIKPYARRELRVDLS
jgi:Leucine-rich repeat (LRR) protein